MQDLVDCDDAKFTKISFKFCEMSKLGVAIIFTFGTKLLSHDGMTGASVQPQSLVQEQAWSAPLL